MKRLDTYLVENGFIKSREKAKDSIQKGLVKVNGVVVTKASFTVNDGTNVEYNSTEAMPFVGKGGLKLEKAIKDFGLDFSGKYLLDVGASTGGFTHCALQHGAAYVWAVDVGVNQLDESLRNHPQVCSMEQCDIRTLDERAIPRKVDFIVADLSFISLTIVASYLPKFLHTNGAMMLLIKPQFEAGKEYVNKNGLVLKQNVHVEVLKRIEQSFKCINLYLNLLSYAPIRERNKNIEYISLFRFTTNPSVVDFKGIVDSAFAIQKKLK